ncbi:hypothetical protein PYJ76_11660 [Staphylococcus epidermidis]|nr:hypothetical protein [Staphylococcus epidermidis]MDH8895593.1 hypothetical protein [Staphylococcus epidermidis]
MVVNNIVTLFKITAKGGNYMNLAKGLIEAGKGFMKGAFGK